MTENFKNYYRVLRVSPTAEPAEIKAAFRRIARRHHPDVARSERSARRFPDIVEAYGVLSDPEQRRRYDQIYRQRQPAPRRRTAFGLAIDLLGLRLGLGVQAEVTRRSRTRSKRSSSRRHDGPAGGTR